MPGCTNCGKALAWGFDGSKFTTSSGEIQYSSKMVRDQLKTVLFDLGYPGAPPTADAPVFCLCDTCWAQNADAKSQSADASVSGAWTGGAATYAGADGAKAKTTAEGVFIAIEHKDHYISAGGPPNTESILSCMTHEMMHFWSHLSRGFQGAPGPNFDECMADKLGYMTYRKMGLGSTYITPYGETCKFTDKLADKWKTSLSTFKLTELLNKKTERGKLPKFLAHFFEGFAPPPPPAAAPVVGGPPGAPPPPPGGLPGAPPAPPGGPGAPPPPPGGPGAPPPPPGSAPGPPPAPGMAPGAGPGPAVNHGELKDNSTSQVKRALDAAFTAWFFDGTTTRAPYFEMQYAEFCAPGKMLDTLTGGASSVVVFREGNIPV